MSQNPAVDDDLRGVVRQLCQAHPRFPTTTIERLVERSSRGLRGFPPSARPEVVRRIAEEQLEYLDGTA